MGTSWSGEGMGSNYENEVKVKREWHIILCVCGRGGGVLVLCVYMWEKERYEDMWAFFLHQALSCPFSLHLTPHQPLTHTKTYLTFNYVLTTHIFTHHSRFNLQIHPPTHDIFTHFNLQIHPPSHVFTRSHTPLSPTNTLYSRFLSTLQPTWPINVEPTVCRNYIQSSMLNVKSQPSVL